MTRRKKGSLSQEDRSLWEAVRQTATPLRPHSGPTRNTTLNTALNKPVKKSGPKPIDQAPLHFDVGAKAVHTPMGHDLSPSVSERLAQAPVQMDRKKYGKMQRGKLTPEARIDLHGMTLAQAHPALNRFIMSSASAGRRLVLVITGKGKHRDEGGPIPIRKGVLKNQVPHWLHQPPLSTVILQVTEAHLSHGGAGAYYVYLRRAR